MISILIVDDDKQVLNSLNRLLRSPRYDLTLVDSPEEALRLCELNSYALIISDQKMPVMSGTELMFEITKLQSSATRIILSGFSDFDEIVTAFNNATIHQFISKPWDNEALLEIVEAELTVNEIVAVPDKNTKLADENGLSSFHGLLTSDQGMLALFEKIKKAAKTGVPVFIFGETGAGKEYAARALHIEGENCSGPFVAVNCANFNDQLMESQLFGHVKGAFTGADSDKKGLLAEADGGSLFLDEISTLSPGLQAKLLRTLQEKEYSPVGCSDVFSFKANIISASNRHLSEAVSNHDFREDLYYRLCVIPLQIPPLRSRGDDVLRLFRHFLDGLSCNKHFREGDELEVFLSDYKWPGNVRELINVCQYVATMTEGSKITRSDLPDELLVNEIKSVSDESTVELNEELILDTLARHKNNKTGFDQARCTREIELEARAFRQF
jgi:DNA-binding NtrC family response regulator